MGKRNKTGLIQIRVSPEDRTAWQDAANAAGMTLSEWMRARCNGGVFIEAPAPKRRAA